MKYYVGIWRWNHGDVNVVDKHGFCLSDNSDRKFAVFTSSSKAEEWLNSLHSTWDKSDRHFFLVEVEL